VSAYQVWKLREGLFVMAGVYVLKVGDETLTLDVDAFGRFAYPTPAPASLGAFAQRVGGTKL